MRITHRKIVVSNLEILLSIGIHAHEKTAAQRLLVTVEADIEGSDSGRDDVGETVDYDRICDFIRLLAQEPHIELQETVARRVLEFTLALDRVSAARVETRKPDVFDDCDYVGTILSGVSEAFS